MAHIDFFVVLGEGGHAQYEEACAFMEDNPRLNATLTLDGFCSLLVRECVGVYWGYPLFQGLVKEDRIRVLRCLSMDGLINFLDYDDDEYGWPSNDGCRYMAEAGLLMRCLEHMAELGLYYEEWPHARYMDPCYMPEVSDKLVSFFTKPLATIFLERCSMLVDNEAPLSLYYRLLEQPAVFKAIARAKFATDFKELTGVVARQTQDTLSVHHCMAIALLPLFPFGFIKTRTVTFNEEEDIETGECSNWQSILVYEGVASFFVQLRDRDALVRLLDELDKRGGVPERFSDIIATFPSY